VNKHTINYQLPRARLPRRLAALFYDSLVMTAVLLGASALVLPLSHGRDPAVTGPFLSAYLLVVSFGFCAWFWTHGGQSLGMRAWRVKLACIDGSPLGWRTALARFALGLPAWALLLGGAVYRSYAKHATLPEPLAGLGDAPGIWLVLLGAAWLILDHSSWSWRDRWSHTTVFGLPRRDAALRSGDAA